MQVTYDGFPIGRASHPLYDGNMRRLMVSLSIALCVTYFVSWTTFADEPFFVYGEANLAAFMQGLSGNGTEQNPYRLSLGRIDIERGDYGLWLENIDSFLIVERCDISGVLSPTSVGAIVLRNCRNVVIRDCEIRNNRTAIAIYRSESIRVENNLLIDNQFGIMLDMFSENNTFIANRLDNGVNANATRPNTWSRGGIGNCWSSSSSDGDAYTIAPWNRDYHPTSFCCCPEAVDAPPPPVDSTPPTFYGSTTGVFEFESGADLVDMPRLVCAQDDRDGAILCTIALETINPCLLDQDQTATIEACDESGNCSEKEISVRIVDTTPPQILFNAPGPLAFEMGIPLESLLETVSAADACSANVPLRIDYQNLDTCTPGEGEVTFIATDAAGNVSEEDRVVRIVDTQAPSIELLGDNPWLVELNAPIQETDPGIVITESFGCDFVGSEQEIYDAVDTSNPGIYEIVYSACDASANCSETIRQVIVGMGLPPDIEDASPLEATYQKWAMEGDIIRCVIEIGNTDSATYPIQLYFGAILKAIALKMPPNIELPLHYEFVSEANESLYVGELNDRSRALLTTESTVLDVFLADEPIEDQLREQGDFRVPAGGIADARLRADAVVRYYAEGPSAVLVKAYVESYNSPVQFFVDVSYYEAWELSQSLHNLLADQTKSIAAMIQTAMHDHTGVAISAFDEEYGLLYRGMILAGAAEWVEGFVHPSL
ncbi:immunoglobulin-like domain-containing protein [Candidatus Bipolaricaulota bacterium]